MCNRIWFQRFCDSPRNRCSFMKICPAKNTNMKMPENWKCPVVAYLEFIGEYDDE